MTPPRDEPGAPLQARLGEFITLRRAIHAQPELAFAEHATAALVAARLTQFGYTVTRGLGGTGLVGTLRRGSGPRAIGIRADMDALPMSETGARPWRSQIESRMHACGHDGHTATLLAAARLIAEDATFDGTVHLIFQPAEEGAGGALRMLADGLFEQFPCEQIFALHNLPGSPAGQFVFRAGPAMASSDDVTIVLHGTGGHGALPQHTRDPVVAAASLVMALQSIVARNVDPQAAAVVTVGALHAGTANNIIPAEARLALSVRALDPAVRQQLRERITAVAEAQAASYGVTATIDRRAGYAVLVNDAAATDLARAVALDLFGPERVVGNGPALMASEDFAFMLERVPGCYLFVGNGAAGTPGGCMVHHPDYDFNDDLIAPAAWFWQRLVEAALPAAGPATRTF